METLYLIKIGELSLKGRNKGFFEKKLKNNIRRAFKVTGITGVTVFNTKDRFFVRVPRQAESFTESLLSKTFGIIAFHKTLQREKTWEAVALAVAEIAQTHAKEGTTFRISARRADKGFPMRSDQIAREAGGVVLDKYPFMKVKLEKFDWSIGVEIRDHAFIYGPAVPGIGGMPTGSAGKGLLLLSGGIDSPVAGWMMSKRGLKLEAVTFPTYPYTGEEAMEKVRDLCRVLAPYNVGMRLWSIPFTEVGMHIRKNAPDGAMTLCLRAAMMQVAGLLARERDQLALVTGESLAQVASQTLESIRFTDSASPLPVFRPVIGWDKEEIITLAKKIGTYEISIRPFEDCCTVFAPQHPLVRPGFHSMTKVYEELKILPLLEDALSKKELFVVECGI